MTDIAESGPATADPAPPASLTAISIRAGARKPEKLALTPAAKKPGDLTSHLTPKTEAPAPAAPPAPSLAAVVEPAPAPPAPAIEPPTQAPPSLSVVASAAASEPVAIPIEPRQFPAGVAAPSPPVPEFPDAAGYWRYLCGSAEYPSVAAIDRELVAKRWPGTLLISFTRSPDDPRRTPSIGGVARLGTASLAMQEAIDSGSYAIEWMIEVGRASLSAAAPLEELQRLPTRGGNIAFRLLALPLGRADAEPDTVLCQLAPAAAAPRFGKRRNWLAA